jgi:uncharacterized protein (DUF305 family)
MTMYWRFGASLIASLGVMYLLAFSQIDQFSHFKASLSVLWISLSMVSAMGLIMLAAMSGMLKNTKLNLALYAVFGALLVGAFTGGRFEALVGDDAFLGSMIPHHSRAIHMCQEAKLSDPQIIDLCGRIIEAQREEIAEMEAIIARRNE